MDESTTQEEMYGAAAEDIVDKFTAEGKSGLIFTYGVTNAGKSFTVMGTKEQPGLMPRAITSVCESLAARPEGDEHLEDGRYLRVKFHGQGILGAAFTSGDTFHVADAHLHYAYDPSIDELICQLPNDETALMAVPLRDHFGRVIGVRARVRARASS